MRVLFKNYEKGLEAEPTYLRVRAYPPICAVSDAELQICLDMVLSRFWIEALFATDIRHM